MHNLRAVDVDVPRDALTVFTGVSGSGKSSLAFGTLVRRGAAPLPRVRRAVRPPAHPAGGRPAGATSITGLPPAVALQQRRGAATARSSVGTVTTLSNSLRMLYSRAGTYPPGAERLDSDAFSPNTAAGACPECHGLGRVHLVTEESMVPDPSLTIRERAIAAWPGAWLGKNLRDILVSLGHDIDRPWRELTRPTATGSCSPTSSRWSPCTPSAEAGRIQRPYQGTYMSARRHVLHTFADSESRPCDAGCSSS